MLASYYLKQLGEQQGSSARLLPDAVEAMRRHNGPGNVRELKNVLERALAFCDNGVIGPEDLKLTGGKDEGVAASLDLSR